MNTSRHRTSSLHASTRARSGNRLGPVLGLLLSFGFVCGTAVTVPSCASTETPEGSSSSHWVTCSSDAACAPHDDSTCGEDGYCVDESGERIEVEGIGTTNDADDDSDDDVTGDDDASAVPLTLHDCEPLAHWQRQVDVSEPLFVARDAAGNVYTATELDSDHIVFRSNGDTLEPLRVIGSGADSDELSLSVDDGADGFLLLVTMPDEPASATLFVGSSDDRELDPLSGEALELIDQSALDDFTVAPIDHAPVVEVHASDRPGIDERSIREVILLRPEWAYGYEDFRLFIGEDDVLSEVIVENVLASRDNDGSSLIDYTTLAGETKTLAYSPGGGASFAIDVTADQYDPLWQRASTALGLERLSFRCLDPVARRFEASGAVPEPATMQCTERVRMGGCVTTNPIPEPPVTFSAPPLDVTGTLTALGEGLPPGGSTFANGDPQNCPFGFDNTTRFGDIYESESDPTLVDELRWFHIEYDGGDTFIVLRVPDMVVTLEAGATVHLVQGAQQDFGGATDSFVELRDEADELVLWLGQSYTLEELDVPAEVTLEPGIETCALSDTCALDYGYNAIEVTLGTESGTALQGESLDLGSYRFTNSAFQIQTGAFVCTDSTAYFIRMALWRR